MNTDAAILTLIADLQRAKLALTHRVTELEADQTTDTNTDEQD